jgi:hypothetical protein
MDKSRTPRKKICMAIKKLKDRWIDAVTRDSRKLLGTAGCKRLTVFSGL